MPAVAIVIVFDHSVGVDCRCAAFVGAVLIQSSDKNGHHSLLGSAVVIALGRTVLMTTVLLVLDRGVAGRAATFLPGVA